MSNNLSSIGALAYQGTNAQTPPNVFVFYVAPDANDFRNFSLGDFWIYRLSNTSNLANVYMLLGLANNTANWVLVANQNGAIFQVTTDAGAVLPVNGNINLLGGHDINTSGSGDTATVNLDNAITLGDLTDISLTPALTIQTGDLFLAGQNLSAATNPLIRVGPNGNIISFLYNNIFMGSQAGNTTMTPNVALFNYGYGAQVLQSLTTGTQNHAYGNGCLQHCTTGQNNNGYGFVCLNDLTVGVDNNCYGNQSGAFLTSGSRNSLYGDDSGSSLTLGSFNCFYGADSGINYTTTSSSNVCIANPGIVGVENNTIRIGTQGSGNLQQNRNFQAGISGVSPSGVATSLPVLIDSNGQLGATGNLYLPATNTAATAGVINVNGDRFISSYGIRNTFVGDISGNTTTTAIESSGYGHNSLNALAAGASYNSAFGAFSGYQLVSGTLNTFVGRAAGAQYLGAESKNVCVSNQGILGDNGTIRIGTSGDQVKNFQAGIFGVTTDTADAIPVLISSDGQLGTVSSSMRYKTNIQDLNGQSENIYKLRPVSFNYISHPDNEAWGLIAEEVEKVLPQIVVYNKDQQPETVKYQDINILLLNELQKLNKKMIILEQEVASLRNSNK